MKIDIVKRAKKMTVKAYQLDMPYQNHRILRAGVNLYLAHLLRSDCRNKVFPGEKQGGRLMLRNGKIVFNINELTSNLAAIQRADLAGLPYELQQMCRRADMKNADEVLVRLAGLCNPVRTSRTDIKEFSETMTPAEQAAVLEEYDRQTTCQLARYFGLDGGPVSPLHHPMLLY